MNDPQALEKLQRKGKKPMANRTDALELADWIEANGLSHFNLEFGIGKERRVEQIAMIVAALRAADAVSEQAFKTAEILESDAPLDESYRTFLARQLRLAIAAPQPETAGVRDLIMFWQGRCNALRILDSKRGQSDHATLETAWAYEECAKELRAALATRSYADRAQSATAFDPELQADGDAEERT